MTDRLKGVLVTFSGDIRDDDAAPILEAIKMIKGVLTVKPYVTGMEDYMLYEKGLLESIRRIMDFIFNELTTSEKI